MINQCQLQFLEISGVTTRKPAAILFILLESSRQMSFSGFIRGVTSLMAVLHVEMNTQSKKFSTFLIIHN